jgi:hypothetical protein
MGVSWAGGDQLVAGEVPDGRIRLGVVGATDAWLAELKACVAPDERLELIVVPDLGARLPAGTPALEWDVALAFLSAQSLRALTDVLTLHDRLGSPEIVAVAESPNDAAVVALRELGVERVLPQDLAGAWLSDCLGPLASIALAKRLLRRCREAIREAPRVDPLSSPQLLPLAISEARYREAYLRALMAKMGSRAEAAKGAGVPYRTLCYMLERYGI